MPDTGAPYFIPFLDGTELVRGYPDFSEDLADAIVNALEAIPVKEKRIARFTGSGTWTVPAGVTYAIAHMTGGGGGIGQETSGGNGGASSVAFSSGTVSAAGGRRGTHGNAGAGATAGANNSGHGAYMMRNIGNTPYVGFGLEAAHSAAGANVTPGQNISVTVGNGGSAGTSGAAGGSGVVWIEFYV